MNSSRWPATNKLSQQEQVMYSICINGIQITFQDVLFSPELNMNFVSVSRVVDKGLSVVFNSKAAEIKRKDGSVVLRAVKEHNLFVVGE